MRVLGVVWVGTRTEAFDETVGFFRDALGVPMEVIAPDFGWSRMPDSSQLEVFGPGDGEHRHFATGPVPEFLVEDLPAALEELRAAGVEILGEPHLDGMSGWLHFRAPDGNVYGLTAAPTYRRVSSEHSVPATDAAATQLRDYRIVAGELDRFVSEWSTQLAPLRRACGFVISDAWTIPDEHRFVWLLVHPDGWDAFEAADARYFASPERRGFDPDPARLIEEQRNTRLTGVSRPG